MPRAVIEITYNAMPELARRMPEAVSAIVRTSAAAILADVQTGMGEPKSGRIYDVGGGAPHQASAPGEMPAIDTTHLVTSILLAMESPTKAVVYTNADYAEALEFGSPAQHIAPRPFFTPAVERERPNFIDAMRNLEARLR